MSSKTPRGRKAGQLGNFCQQKVDSVARLVLAQKAHLSLDGGELSSWRRVREALQKEMPEIVVPQAESLRSGFRKVMDNFHQTASLNSQRTGNETIEEEVEALLFEIDVVCCPQHSCPLPNT